MSARILFVFIGGLLIGAGCGRDPAPINQEHAGHVYITQDTIEVDTLASIWLILRFVDKQASFQFVPKGALITNGIAFDTPEAEYRRTVNGSCFESILQKHSLSDRKLIQLGRIIHDIEINFWGEKKYAQSLEIGQAVNAIIDKNKNDPPAGMQEAISYFDGLQSLVGAN